jgi:two-component system, sensor histidine kinase RegB
MTETNVIASERSEREAGHLRLRTLIRLRWLAVVGQSFAVFFVSNVLEFPLPLGYCLALIALSAWLNIFLSLRWPAVQRLSSGAAGYLLAYDIVQLAGLLYLTGGLQNPFAFLFLVPVTISATSLPLLSTLVLCGLGFVFATFLAFYHLPLPWSASQPLVLPPAYVAGMWVALISGAVFSTIFARRIAVEGRQMSTALTATELVLAREQRLSALDGLAAAAAHELGTPLATIALVAKELRREFPANSPHSEDLDLLVSQAARCRVILSKLANHEQAADEIYGQVKLSIMLEDLVAPLRGPDVQITITAQPLTAREKTAEPVFMRNPAIAYGLGNILENATDFATAKMDVLIQWSKSVVMVTVKDDGPGFDQMIFDRLGDPFVTTRPGYGAALHTDTELPGDVEKTGHDGMGLGLFIAKTLLERTGASVKLSNRKLPDNGAIITVQWPRLVVDVSEPT